MKPQLSFLYVPGPESGSDTDVHKTDKFFCVPHVLIEQAIKSTKKSGEKYIYFNQDQDQEWKCEDVLPSHIDRDFAVRVTAGEITSHEIMSTV